jgi:cell division protein FtsX
MVLAKALLIDMRLAPNLTFIAFVTWKEVLLILPVLYLVGVAIASIASAVALRRHLRV